MRIIRTKHTRLSDSNLTRDMRRIAKGETSYFSGSYMTLLILAVLPLVVMMIVTFCNYVIDLPMFVTHKRQPYSFNWGQAIELRSHLAAQYNQEPYLPSGVPRRSDMSVAEFRDVWDTKWPLIVTDVVPAWGAYHWSKDFFYKFYSKSNLTVTQTKGSLGSASGEVMSLGEFYKLTFEKTTPNSWTYATDEHFITNHPQLLLDIGTNRYADENYFKYFPEEIRPKNAMLLWGTKHSRSYLHVDPYNWTGTIALLKGTKKWKMWPPNPDNSLKFSRRRSGFPLDCPTLVSSLDFFSDNPPQILGEGGSPRYSLVFEQRAGDLLFIPTGWAHQAYNAEETLAISSQFMNRNNYRAVLEEIIHCTGTESSLPHSYTTLTAEQQVKVVLSLLPEHILETAKQTNSEVRNRLMCGEQDLGS